MNSDVPDAVGRENMENEMSMSTINIASRVSMVAKLIVEVPIILNLKFSPIERNKINIRINHIHFVTMNEYFSW